MGDEITEQSGKIPDLPAGLAEPEPIPPLIWIALRPGLFGLPVWAIVVIHLSEVLLLILLARVLCGFLLRERSVAPGPPLPPPAEEAKATLAKLGQSSGRSLRELALLLSATLRRFVEREYGIDLTTRTREEFSALLTVSPDALPQGYAAGLHAFLQACDQAKFKPGEVEEEFKQQLWDQANLLIEKAPRAVQPNESH